MAEESDAVGSEYEWELSRENIQPLRGGRRVTALTQEILENTQKAKKAKLVSSVKNYSSAIITLHGMMMCHQDFTALTTGSFKKSDAVTRMEEAFSLVSSSFQSLKDGEVEADPLGSTLQFISWFDEYFPIGRHKQLYNYLWIIVNKLTAVAEYSEDERMLKVWSKLAATSLGNELNVYQHANCVRSLTRNATFYVNWSRACEDKGAVDEARKVLARGKRAGATPIGTLHDAEDELEMRVLRKFSQDNSNLEEEGDELDENGERRSVFTRLAGLGKASVAPIVRLPSIAAEEVRQGMSKLNTPAVKKTSQKSNANFERSSRTEMKSGETVNLEDENMVCMDIEEDVGMWLEDIYERSDMFCRLERIDLTAPSAQSMKSNNELRKVGNNAPASFEVYEGDAVNKKPRIMLKKILIRDSSIEENLADKWSVVFASNEGEGDRPKLLHLSKMDIKPLSFD